MSQSQQVCRSLPLPRCVYHAYVAIITLFCVYHARVSVMILVCVYYACVSHMTLFCFHVMQYFVESVKTML